MIEREASTPGALHSTALRGRKAHDRTYRRLNTTSRTAHNAGYGWAIWCLKRYEYPASPLKVASACCLFHLLIHIGR
jgi:hypothetical protein